MVGPGHRVFTFAKAVAVEPGGPKLRHVVRVTIDADGRILKVVTAR
jgi:hypothetical protein